MNGSHLGFTDSVVICRSNHRACLYNILRDVVGGDDGFFQMIIIMVGMLLVAWYVSDDAGGVTTVVSQAFSDGKFSLFGDEGITIV